MDRYPDESFGEDRVNRQDRPVLTIVSVLYGGHEVLEKTLATWRASIDSSIEVVFVDHSPTSMAEVLDLSWARHEWNPDNPGFAAGVNRAVELANSGHIFLLNPDVFLTPTALARIASAKVTGPAAIALRTGGVEHSGIEYSRWGFCRDRVDVGRHLVGASGGAALFPRHLVHEQIPFPEHLFAWGEDAEWSLWLISNGIETTEIGDVILDHVGGHSVSSSAGQRLKARLLVRNRIATFRRALSRGTKVRIGVPFFAAIAANGARKVAQGVGWSYLQGIVEGLRMEVPPRLGAPIAWPLWKTLTERSQRR